MALRTDTESNFVERKTLRDKDGWLHSAVAFANSAPIDYPAVLFVGVKNDGCVENANDDHNWETQQMKVNQEINRAYPPIYRVCKVLRDDAGQFLAVIIPGSLQRPHFAGKSYVRVGPETIEASEEQFNLLIAERTAKVYKIREWLGKNIVFARFDQAKNMPAKLLDCTQHYLSVLIPGMDRPTSFPINRIELSFDHDMKCLALEIREEP
jgi:hypothetical protein